MADPLDPEGTTRRTFLGGALGIGALSVLGCNRQSGEPQTPRTPGTGAFANGAYFGDLPFDGEVQRPLGTLTGEGLDARQRLDLAALTPERLLVPAADFYVRT